jgi:hypothetical protein
MARGDLACSLRFGQRATAAAAAPLARVSAARFH